VFEKGILQGKRNEFFIFGRVQKGKVRFFQFLEEFKKEKEAKVFSIFGRVQKGKGRFFQFLEECKRKRKAFLAFEKVQKGKGSILPLT
jgi:hypothetical protein